ncbi:hypothetical protein ABBQ38_014024 [Trebouxia sp. C0009 RCD-2024]
MQAFKAFNRTSSIFSKAACYQTQLPKLTKWHADFTSYSSAPQHALSIPVRAFSSIPLSTGKQHLVILGTGWAAARLFRDIDCNYFDITVVSPRNHMVFTPLLTSACVGTLEFRSVAVSIMSLQKHLKEPQNNYFLASAQNVDPEKKVVHCKDEEGKEFSVPYDKLVVATGSQGSTFGIPGVEKYAHPLRDISHATAIRNHLIANWSLANTPNRTATERQRLLSVLVVGGGPTGVEFAGELSDFINKDLRRLDNGRASEMRVTLIEAQQLLGTFDAPLREYAANKLNRQGVHLLKGMVKELTPTEAHLSTGEVLPYGIAVWSTGVGPTSFTTSLPFAKTARGRIAIDGEMRALQHVDPEKTAKSDPEKPSDVKMHVEEHDTGHGKEIYSQVDSCYALGDCCANMELPLPALAQVAEQQGKYLARTFNALAKDPNAKIEPFSYKHLGSMASIGGNKALIQLGEQGSKHFSMKGFKSYLAWRSAYLTRLGNAQNRLYVVINWLTTTIFGRDMSRW